MFYGHVLSLWVLAATAWVTTNTPTAGIYTRFSVAASNDTWILVFDSKSFSVLVTTVVNVSLMNWEPPAILATNATEPFVLYEPEYAFTAVS